MARLDEFESRVRTVVADAWPDARIFLWGHVGEGNLHVNVVGPAPGDDAVDAAVLRLVLELGSSIGSEHGIGVAKVGWLALDRGDVDLDVMRAIKRALDPQNLLNPGVLFPLTRDTDPQLGRAGPRGD